ncbi:PREDICTED: uncharacterized protein LOC105565135 [Vollenhovia emeryi]|uniref:uncharacterized protein LOC105565135 n=1 Tax=Vollenhovia emeryi TaxID=411798 RepID=UPI0005F3B986|nr:PREDICTED: uncharacterized protein LOC105565135 [Vollenhovia emeryi]
MSNAVEEEKKRCAEKGQRNEITVSGDGSWRKRGFSSLFGIVSLIGWYTGKVLDIVVKSKYCKACEYWKKKEDTAEYKEWIETHEENCQSNHEGSAGRMEVDGVLKMFQRSEELHNVKYANYVGDGDSKTFKETHGYSTSKSEKKSKGLGGKGKLTGKLIDELSIYYGLAIRRNSTSIENMRNDIWATLYHKISTNEKPQHERCPAGPDSWCTWQKAKASNTLATYVHKPPISGEVFTAITPIYEELSSDNLLNRCLGAFTQNSNESFNSTVWAIAPKSTSSGKKILDISCDIAVRIFNDGMTNIMRIMQVLGLIIGPNCYNFCIEVDERRVKLAERILSDAAREARQSLKSARKEKEDEDLNLEGQLYGADIAD